MSKLITLFAVLGMVLALAPAARAAIIVNGVAQSDPRTTTGVYNLSNSGVNSIDGGSLWTHNDDLLKIGNQGSAGTLTVSGGGVLDITAATVPDGNYAFQVGNKALGTMVITGAGSTVKTLAKTAIGRGEIEAGKSGDGSTITIDDGGLLISDVVKIGRDSSADNVALRMGAAGILAIEGTGKAVSQLWSTDNSAGGNMMQYNPSGDGTTWVNITGATSGVDYTIADGTGDLAGYSVLTMASGTTSTPGTMIIVQ